MPESSEIILVIISALVATIVYITRERILDFLRNKQSKKGKSRWIIIKAVDSEIRRYGKSRNITEQEKNEALECYHNELAPKRMKIEGQISGIQKQANKFLNIHFILLIPLLPFILWLIFFGATSRLQYIFWGIIFIFAMIEFGVAAYIFTKRSEQYYELFSVNDEIIKITRLIGKDLVKNIDSLIIKMLIEGNFLSPIELSEEIETITAIYVHPDSIATIMLDTLYPIQEVQSKFIRKALKSNNVSTRFENLSKDEKKQVIDLLAEEFNSKSQAG